RRFNWMPTEEFSRASPRFLVSCFTQCKRTRFSPARCPAKDHKICRQNGSKPAWQNSAGRVWRVPCFARGSLIWRAKAARKTASRLLLEHSSLRTWTVCWLAASLLRTCELRSWGTRQSHGPGKQLYLERRSQRRSSAGNKLRRLCFTPCNASWLEPCLHSNLPYRGRARMNSSARSEVVLEG